MQSFPQSVKSTLNFVADRADGGRFSNTTPSLTRQKHQPVEVEINNVRAMPRKPALEVEGFTVAAHPVVGKADWSNRDWIEGEYAQSCIDLIKRLTGVKKAFNIQGSGGIRRSDHGGSKGTMPAARFIHMDNPRDVAHAMYTPLAEAHGVKVNRATVFNIWKAISPPPQSLPLAVCDWRTVSEKDHVIGLTVETLPPLDPTKATDRKNVEALIRERATDQGTIELPYVVLAHSPDAPKWYYVPDLNIDETLVFVGADLDPSHPLGCAHSAFVPPGPEANGAPRVSIEMRVIACFD